jgi:hypothetical protein
MGSFLLCTFANTHQPVKRDSQDRNKPRTENIVFCNVAAVMSAILSFECVDGLGSHRHIKPPVNTVVSSTKQSLLLNGSAQKKLRSPHGCVSIGRRMEAFGRPLTRLKHASRSSTAKYTWSGFGLASHGSPSDRGSKQEWRFRTRSNAVRERHAYLVVPARQSKRLRRPQCLIRE